MSWFGVWDTLKNKTCRYLLQRYLGQFLEEKLNLEQLNIELYNGRAMIKDVALKVETINELFENQGWAFEVIEGHIGTLTVTVPWNALMTTSSFIEIRDLIISLRPIKRNNDGKSMVESMWSSVSSSMQLAEECMNQNNDRSPESESISIIGLEKFAETIDNVLNRINACCRNTILRFEYTSQNRSKGIAIVCKIENFTYKNETGCNQSPNTSPNHIFETRNETENVQFMSSFAKHNIVLNGITFYTEEFENMTSMNNTNYMQSSIEQCKSREHNDIQIPLFQIKGTQRMEIRMKQSEEIIGPKVKLDIEIGSIYSLLTPRQIHLLFRLYKAFQEEEISSTMIESKVINHDIFETQKISCMGGVINKSGTWSEHVDLPIEKNSNINIKLCENMCESFGSTASTTTCSTTMSKLQRNTSNVTNCSDILSFNIKISSLLIILLHEDIIEECGMKKIPTEESQYNMFTVAQKFFNSLQDDVMQNLKMRSKENHVLLLLSPLSVEGFQQRKRKILIAQHTLTASRVDITEFLGGNEVPIIIFDRSENHFDGYPKRPELLIKTKSSSSGDLKENSHISLNIVLDKNIVDCDITIYDRLRLIFGPSPFEDHSWTILSKNDKSNLLIDVNIITDMLEVLLRFPILQVNAFSDSKAASYAKQKIRPDFLNITFSKLNIKYCGKSFEICANEINIYYCENVSSKKVHILKTHLVKNKQKELVYDYPRINITKFDLPNFKHSDNNCRIPKDVKENLCRNTNYHMPSGPFSSKRECRQSDTTHAKRESTDSETVLLPGEREELNEFCKRSSSNSKLYIKMNIPILQVNIESKQLYEILYNRLNNELFMWEPQSSVSKRKATDPLDIGLTDSLYISSSKSNPSDEHKNVFDNMFSEFDSDENILNDKNYTNDDFKKCYSSSNTKAANDSVILQNNCAIEINIERGSLNLYLPVRDVENHVLPGQLGQMLIDFNNSTFFIVNGYESDASLDFVCLRFDDFNILHCGLVPVDCTAADEENSASYMQPTFIKIPKDLTKGIRFWNNKREMVSIAIELKKDLQQYVKRLKMAAGFQKLLLKYNPSISSYFWLTQLMDFLDITDFPMEGYQPLSVVTEVQLHFWDCAVDYRPRRLPYRTVLEFSSMSLSSNIISSVNTSHLRLVIEEGLLSIAPFNPGKDLKVVALPSKYLVPVLDVGLLDVSLRLDDNFSGKIPKFDLRCSVYDVHLRTCADSGSALARLIYYIANDGDVLNSENTEMCKQSTNLKEDLFSYGSETVPQMISKKQQDRVNSLMAEAVKDTINDSKLSCTRDNVENLGVNIFYFPDEEQRVDKAAKNEFCDILNFEPHVILSSSDIKSQSDDIAPEVKADLGDCTRTKMKNILQNQPEDDYCIIADEEQIFMSQCGIKDFKLIEDPIRIVDNHFCLPNDKTDFLQPPENLPIPNFRYTLCEMSFTWHLYGGTDFSYIETLPNKKINKKSENLVMSETYKHGVSCFKNNQGIQITKKPKEKLTWKSVGGSSRNHEVLVELCFSKMRFSHEVYAKNSFYASRQVFLVNEIEIRDRLQSSEINKFLYCPNLKNQSQKNSQHTVIVKALHIRPNVKESVSQECSLRISLLPMRLHIDQDTLVFLTDFFTNMSEMRSEDATNKSEFKLNKLDHQNPVMIVDDTSEIVQDFQARKFVTTNLELLMDDESGINSNLYQNECKLITENEVSPIYFREIIFNPEVSIRFDYHGRRRIDLSRGPVAGLLMGLGQLQCSEILLKKVEYRRGILGLEKMFTFLCKQWLKDIKTNQLQKILSGVGPAHAFVQLFHGIYDLFWLPIEQYQRDGRIIRGIQLGAQSFTARTALAALEITSRLIQILQFTAETAFDLVSPGPTVRISRKTGRGKKKRPNRPKDIREGVTNAYFILKEGINDSANNLIETAMAQHDQKGYTGAVGAVVRQIPQLVVCPAVLATQATTNILGGVKNSLLPEAKLEAREKWKDENDI